GPCCCDVNFYFIFLIVHFHGSCRWNNFDYWSLKLLIKSQLLAPL
ncbi:hypothetical protein ACHAWX_007283, partial [Stephanocyclus meneghinianus]